MEWEDYWLKAIMRRKVLPADVGRTPMDLMALRHLADYKSQSVSATEAKRAFDRAKRFLHAVGEAFGSNS